MTPFRGLSPLSRRTENNRPQEHTPPIVERRLTPPDDGPKMTAEQRAATARRIVFAGMKARGEVADDADSGEPMSESARLIVAAGKRRRGEI